jgi:hypothetical protein
MPGAASRQPMARRVTIFGMRKCSGCGQRLPRPLPGAGRLLNETGYRSLGLEPAAALSEAKKTAKKLKKIFAS